MISTTKTFSEQVSSLQSKFTEQWHLDVTAQANTDDILLRLIIKQHKFNFDLWHEEDKAREPNAKDATIAHVKRNIDALNQHRNNTITEIDECLEQTLFAKIEQDETLPWNSETVGSIVDRLSIAALKVFHMQEQADRDDADDQHKQNCAEKVALLRQQQDDLSRALQLLINDIAAGRKRNKLYRQFKMYNDPTLNPKIYQSQSKK